jgi:hypothetical protein
MHYFAFQLLEMRRVFHVTYLWITLKISGHLEYDDPIVEVRVEIVHSGPNSQAVHPVPVHLHIKVFV